MKRIISISILLIVMFITFEFVTNYFKEGHEINYQIMSDNNAFDIIESYHKEYNNSYDIVIKNDKNAFYYTLSNVFNKQKQIIKEIYYYEEDDNSCIYPILKDKTGLALQCLKDGKLYSMYTYPNSSFISNIKDDLLKKGYNVNTINDTNETNNIGNSIVYKNSLLEDDIITLWNYKGIQIIKKSDLVTKNVIGFDKYENNHGYLVDNYYIIPAYTSKKVLEFNKVNIINLNTLDSDKIELNNTLSSNTYINGVVDGKLYYTDPSNLLQIEINPKKKNSRLIGSKDIGGQNYQGDWESVNIYDFVSNQIRYSKPIVKEVTDNYSYNQIIESDSSYYYYNGAGEIYKIPKSHLEVSIKIYQANDLNNFNVVGDTVYYIVGDTLYYVDEIKGSIPVLKNNELKYNKNNRISVLRKS